MGRDGITKDEALFLAQVGVRTRRARTVAGLSRRALAEVSGVSERYLAQLEAGQGNVSILLLRRLALALGVDPVGLLQAPADGTVVPETLPEDAPAVDGAGASPINPA